MLFNYESISNTGEKKKGQIDASSKDSAINAIQQRGFVVLSISSGERSDDILEKLNIFKKKGVSMKDIVIMSRQISTLFEAQVSALKAFNLVAENSKSKNLARVLSNISEDIKAGITISDAMARQKDVFSDFYVNMVKSGEESGKLTQVFSYLADYLDRQYALSSKIKNALIYPAFVIGVFILVMIMMFVYIIPKLTVIIEESGQEMPIYTKIIMWVSDLFVNYGLFLFIGAVFIIAYLIRLNKTAKGRKYIDQVKLSVPIFKNIFTKLYLSRIADNMETMLTSGIPIVRSLEITGSVVGSKIYQDVLKQITDSVKAGSSLSDAFSKHPEFPQIMNGMIRVGEETGALGNILKTLGRFYAREVSEGVDTMVGLIEPLMIVVLGLGVGVIMAAVLMPIYNIAGTF